MLLLLCVIGLVLGGVASQTTPKPQRTKATVTYPNLEDELTNRGNYNTFLDLVNTAGLMSTLMAADKITIFAPTDAAFAEVPAPDLAALINDKQRLADLLSYHVTTDKAYHVKRHSQDKVFNSYNNKPIRINLYKLVHSVTAEGVNITDPDIHIANGYVQGLANIMTPPNGDVVDIITSRSDMTTLASLVSKAGLVDTLRDDYNITVFAPTDSAFAKVSSEIMDALGTHDAALKETLLFHVVTRLTLYSIGMRHTMTFPTADNHHDRLMLLENSNGEAFINHAKISETDISATNGVIHVIDDVLVPIKVLIGLEDAGITVG